MMQVRLKLVSSAWAPRLDLDMDHRATCPTKEAKTRTNGKDFSFFRMAQDWFSGAYLYIWGSLTLLFCIYVFSWIASISPSNYYGVMPIKEQEMEKKKERERERKERQREQRLKEEYAEHKDAELFNPVARETAGVWRLGVWKEVL